MRNKALAVGLLFLALFSLSSAMLVRPSPIGDGVASASPNPNLYFIITIDTEGWGGLHPLENNIWGRVDDSGKEYGIPLLMDICDSYGLKATFFVDVYEYRLHGSQAMEEVCKYISSRGMDVQLHTHPSYYYDPTKYPKITQETYDYGSHQWDKYYMKDYSLEDQSAILSEGEECLMQWIGQEPVAHRAGRWAANYATLEALQENRILVDSSMHFEFPDCDLNQPVLTRNAVVERNGVVEVPTSVFKQVRYLKIGPLKIKKNEVISMLGIAWEDVDSEKLEGALTGFKRHDVRIAVLALHSWTFLNWDADFREASIDKKDIEIFDQILAWIANDPEIKVITMKEFCDLYQEDPGLFQGSDYIPEVVCYDSYWQTLKEAAASVPGGIKADIFVAANALFVVVVFAAVVYVVKRRISK